MNRLDNLQELCRGSTTLHSEVETVKPLQQQTTATSTSTNQTSALTHALARKQTRVVYILRVCVVGVLIGTAAVVSTGVYLYTRNQEENAFADNFKDSANQVVDSFHGAIERNMAAVASLSNSITSFALESKADFPFVTLPHFEVLGSDARAQGGSHLIHWCPLVTDDNRDDWETYANATRWHATTSWQQDRQYRLEQDTEFGLSRRRDRESTYGEESELEREDQHARQLQGHQGSRPTTLQDGTNYHPHLWSNGAKIPAGDIPTGKGKYLPLWQQSPVDPRLQSALNIDVSTAVLVADGIIDTMDSEHKALLNYAAQPLESSKRQFQYYLSVSQYRHTASDLLDDWHTLLTYPVFDHFQADKKMVGILSTDIYWKILFSNLLPSNMQGLIVTIENSLNESFSYRIDGKTATALGTGDFHDKKYDAYEVSTNINSHLSERASPENRAYQTVHLSDSIKYTIKVYPSQATQDIFLSKEPLLFTTITLFAFLFAIFVFLLYSYTVERRQRIMTNRVIEQIRKAAETERELNEFLSHEIRNPLSAAISACTFVSAAVNEATPLTDEESRKYAREDIEVVNSSLHFINDFLRSMLDIYRASGNQITVQMTPTDIKQDILMPVSNMLYKRLTTYDVIVDCPDHLVVMTDSTRLKQVLINLARNSSKFVEKGFLRMRAEVDPNDNQVRIFVEDSGPGISTAKKKELFARYQESLDLLQQGTGIGLNLSKKLMRIMKGDLYLSDNYHSGIEGLPGACFVADLRTSLIDLDASIEDLDLEAALPLKAVPPDSEAGISAALADKAVSSAETWTDEDATPHIDSPSQCTLPSGSGDSIEEKKNDAFDDDNTTQPPTPPPVHLPIALAKEPEEEGLPDDITVLFVDDDAMLRKLFMRAVKRAAPASWKIDEASSGEMALKICESGLADGNKFPDIIFMDQYMASVDKQLLGTETTQALRRMGVTTRICGLSANDLRDAFVNAGADDFILKPMPCKPADLKNTLLRILSHSIRELNNSGRSFLSAR